MLRIALSVVWLFQDPAPPAPQELAPELVRAATADLTALAARHRDVQVLAADYEQRRTTELLPEPIVTRGTLAFRRAPGCIVFRAAGERASIVRLDETVYEVHRPARKRLERFRLASPDLPRTLFAALTGDAAMLADRFTITGYRTLGDEGAEHRIELVPKAASLRKHVAELAITVRAADHALLGVAYRDGAGDRIELVLSALRFDPEPSPSFELAVPEDTQVVEHAPPPEPAPEPRREAATVGRG